MLAPHSSRPAIAEFHPFPGQQRMEFLHRDSEQFPEGAGIAAQPDMIVLIHDPAEVADEYRGAPFCCGSYIDCSPIGHRVERAHEDQVIAIQGRGQLLAGFGYVRERPSLLLVIALAGLLGAFGMNGPVVLAAFAERVWHNGVAGFGMFNTFSAVGALAGALLAARLKTLGRKGIVAAAALFGFSQLVAALMPSLVLFVAMLVVVGLMTLLFLTSVATAVQLEAGPEIRGRVMALYLPLLLGGHALGGLLAGWLTEQFGVREGLVTTGALGMLSAAVIGLLLWRNARRRDCS